MRAVKAGSPSRPLSLDEAISRFGPDARNVGAYTPAVGRLVQTLCRLSGLDEATAADWGAAAVLHDIGKLAIPPNILLKVGNLSDGERLIMQRHTVVGYRLLVPFWPLAADMALKHHENLDGSGYPYGLRGDAIPLSARILRLCDVYDALRSARPYKQAFLHGKAVNLLLEGDSRLKPQMFDPDLLALFARHHRSFEVEYEGTDSTASPTGLSAPSLRAVDDHRGAAQVPSDLRVGRSDRPEQA
ncbi:HD domain-containing phosphohydrolase [Azospirillum sp. SYSU D00513]|uniref:HD-GYP domain-containing protein n=1 Tax=Azospirillum sp. SYSU D00513 TaxID=2812561 RepID=UPI001A95A24A|nr:HD domain-containing phosphohydrolase [Azospirillum sp. SYSU D00513]